MMETIDLKSWTDFEPELRRINGQYRSPFARPGTLYRGQANARWEVATTLERRSRDEYTVQRYVDRALIHAAELTTRTGKVWERGHAVDAGNESTPLRASAFLELPHYEYLVYLRQLGFSSPLLDWTASPFVAAYFAFRDPVPERDRVAVFAYIEMPDGLKTGYEGAPRIQTMGPYVVAHPRHFTQQAWYTVAFKERGAQSAFCRHDEVLKENVREQDLMFKFTMPIGDRIAALEFLRSVNITEYTLFHTDDALVKTMDMIAFDLGGR